MRDMRKDVYDTGCGWEDCPTCGPAIEVEKEIAHTKAIGWPRYSLVSEWQAKEREEIDEEKEQALKAVREKDRRNGRMYRKSAEAKLRVKRVLSTEQIEQVNEYLQQVRPRTSKGKAEWLAEVWLELLNPTVTVARKEGRVGKRGGKPLALEKRVQRAIHRAETRLRAEKVKNRRLVSIGNHFR